MDFLTANFVTGGRDPSKGVDNPSLNPALGGRSYAQLANLATDGRSSSWHQQVTAVFLRRCYLEAVEHHEDFRTVSNSDSDEANRNLLQSLDRLRAGDIAPAVVARPIDAVRHRCDFAGWIDDNSGRMCGRGEECEDVRHRSFQGLR